MHAGCRAARTLCDTDTMLAHWTDCNGTMVEEPNLQTHPICPQNMITADVINLLIFLPC